MAQSLHKVPTNRIDRINTHSLNKVLGFLTIEIAFRKREATKFFNQEFDPDKRRARE